MVKAKKAVPAKTRMIGFQGTEEWYAWIKGLANMRRTDVSKLIEQSLIEAAERYGYKEAVPERFSKK